MRTPDVEAAMKWAEFAKQMTCAGQTAHPWLVADIVTHAPRLAAEVLRLESLLTPAENSAENSECSMANCPSEKKIDDLRAEVESLRREREESFKACDHYKERMAFWKGKADAALAALQTPVDGHGIAEAFAAIDDLSDGSRHDWRRFAHILSRYARRQHAQNVELTAENQRMREALDQAMRDLELGNRHAAIGSLRAAPRKSGE